MLIIAYSSIYFGANDSLIKENYDLLNFVKSRLYFPKKEKEKASLSLPDKQQYLNNFTLQLGDGDSFV
jgi:hypothetical protein